MKDDPIVEEVRKAREEYAAQFNFDLDAMITDLQQRTEEAKRQGRTVLEPKSRQTGHPPAKAG